MLDPKNNRLSYGEQLTPPAGFDFDSAISTSYSLDLNALLAVPVALLFRDTFDGDIKGEKLALLEGIGQLKGKLKVFYQKGNIACPAEFNRLFTFLEPCLHPVIPEGGVYSSFHPKLWLLRFVKKDSKTNKEEVRYRLVMLSRNLTFDRSWDVAVTLDGTVLRAKQETSHIKTWLDFTKKILSEDKSFLPGKVMMNELDYVDWELPKPFVDFEVLLGEAKQARPLHFENSPYENILVVSPFLKSTGGDIGGLDWLATQVDENANRFLISRAEEFNAIGEDKLSGWKCFSMNENIVNGEERLETGIEGKGENIQQQNLHAKIIVVESKGMACWHLGSANATAAAIGDIKNKVPRNTEAMLKLVGSSEQVGIEKLLQTWMPDKGAKIFVEHEFVENEFKTSNTLTALLRKVLHQLIAAKWILKALPDALGTYTLNLGFESTSSIDSEIELIVEQLAIPGKKILSANMIWEKVELTRISAFIPVTVKIKNTDVEQKLVIEADLNMEGGDNRQQQIMKEMVNTPGKVLDYIRLLLQVTPDKKLWLGFEMKGGIGSGEFITSGTPILEQLLLASSRHPELLKRIASAITRLEQAEVEIPTEFSSLWKHFKSEFH